MGVVLPIDLEQCILVTVSKFSHHENNILESSLAELATSSLVSLVAGLALSDAVLSKCLIGLPLPDDPPDALPDIEHKYS